MKHVLRGIIAGGAVGGAMFLCAVIAGDIDGLFRSVGQFSNIPPWTLPVGIGIYLIFIDWLVASTSQCRE